MRFHPFFGVFFTVFTLAGSLVHAQSSGGAPAQASSDRNRDSSEETSGDSQPAPKLPKPLAVYYVATTGYDSNPGTGKAPWRTLQKAADAMQPGDMAIVANGKYPEIVISRTAGTAAAPIFFQASSSNVVVSGFDISHAYHVIRGFTLTGAGVASYQGTINARAGANSLVVSENWFNGSPPTVHQFLTASGSGAPTGLLVTGNGFMNGNYHAIRMHGSQSTISSNLFASHKGWDAINLFACNSTIRGNNFIDWSSSEGNGNHTDLIQSFDVNGEKALHVIVEGNFAYNCKNAQIGNIQDTHDGNNVGDWTWRNNVFAEVDWAMSLSARDMKFHNNLFYRCGINTSAVILFRNYPGATVANNGQMLNNLFVGCGDKPNVPTTGWYWTDPGVTGLSADYNLVVGSGAGTTKSTFKTGSLETHGLNGVDPQFVNAGLVNFRLKPTSAAKGSGQNLSALFTADFSGRKRVGPWNRGPY